MAGSIFGDIVGLFSGALTPEQQRAQKVQGLFGAPNAVRVDGTMQSAEFDAQGNPINQRMTSQEPTYQSTGLFQNLPQAQIPQMQAAKQMVSSPDKLMQKAGYDLLDELTSADSGNPSAADYLSAKTFAYGAGDGKMQRGVLDESGKLRPIGAPYDPRNPYLNVGTEFVNPNMPNSAVPINLSQAEFKKKQGVADQKFLDTYSVNVDKGESGLEAMDFLTNSLDELANSATGWSTGMGAVLKDLPTSDANAWQTMKVGVLSGLGLDKMAELKSLSPTGSTGFGALNEKELELLVSYRGKLEQTNNPKQIKRIIGNMQRLINNSRKRVVRRLTNAQKRFDKLAGDYEYDTAGETRLPDNLEPPNRLPQGVTEEDIAVTMKNNDMTRQQVLERLQNGR